MKILPLFLAVISVFMPVVTQRTGLSDKYGFPMKMLCAFLYLFTGLVSAAALYRVTDYSLMILSALAAGLLGDFFLEYKKKKLFPVGVLFFAAGHIAYSYTFLCVGDYKALPFISAVIIMTALITAAIVLFAKTKLKLRGRKNMLLIYVPVLVFAFACAAVTGVTAIREGNFPAVCLVCGGTLFLLSDMMIGLGKGGFQRPDFLHNAVSYTYFAAQTLFALSIYFQ